jgi:hypothetical protein
MFQFASLTPFSCYISLCPPTQRRDVKPALDKSQGAPSERLLLLHRSFSLSNDTCLCFVQSFLYWTNTAFRGWFLWDFVKCLKSAFHIGYSSFYIQSNLNREVTEHVKLPFQEHSHNCGAPSVDATAWTYEINQQYQNGFLTNLV